MRIVFILAVILNGFASSVSAQSADSITPLSELQPEVRDDIARICLPIQYRDGSVAYRNCVKEQITAREESSGNDTVMDTFSSLSFDDRYAIQQACGSSDSLSARECTAQQITALLELPEPNLSTLSNDEQYVMQQTCFHAQSKQGAAAYRQCQLNEVSSVRNIVAPNYANLDAIERNTLQLKCSASQSQLAEYRNCLVAGIESTVGTTTTQTTNTVAEISQTAIEAIDNPAIALATAPAAVRVQTNPSPVRAQPIQPNDKAAVIEPTAVEPEVAELVLIEPAEIEPSNEPALAQALATQTVQTPAQDSVQTLDQNNQAQAQSSTDAPAATTEQTTNVNTAVEPAQTSGAAEGPADNVFTSFKNFVLDTFNGLSSQGKMLLAAVVLMPLALLALLTGRKRRGREYYDEDESDYAHDDRHANAHKRSAPQISSSARFDDTDDIAENWAAEADSLFGEAPTLRPDPAQKRSKRSKPKKPTAAKAAETPVDFSTVDEYAPTKLVSKPPAPKVDEYAPTKLVSKADSPQATQSPPRDVQSQNVAPGSVNSGFVPWFTSIPRSEQQSLAIEFMLYWIAFGDERFEPSLKQQIFKTQDPNNKDIIKRWVLKEDVHAFAAVIDWLQRNTSDIQKVQTVRLLMAMLVNGHEPTPVQNTMFRFLSDAFYFKNPTLEEMFEEDFQATLPAMPRVDRMAWWERQSAGTIASWNARKLNKGDEITRFAAQLGVDGEARSEHVEAAYEQATHRCNPERFDHLSENEHHMIQSRLSRLQQARDGLLEALA